MDVETSAAADSEAPKVRFTALFLQPDLLSYRDEMRIRSDRTQSKAAAIFSFPSFKSHCKCSYIK